MNSVKKGHLMELPNRVLIGHDIIGEFGSFLNDLGVDKPVLFVSGKNVQNVVKSSITESLEISQHKFDFSNQKYKKYILEILNEKDFKEMGLWDIKKINDDYNNNQNINKIWILCKYFLMIKGFGEKYKSIEKNINIPEKFNYLCEPI